MISGISSIEFMPEGITTFSPEATVPGMPKTIAQVPEKSDEKPKPVAAKVLEKDLAKVAQETVKVPFDAGKRVEPPVSHQKPIKTVPNPVEPLKTPAPSQKSVAKEEVPVPVKTDTRKTSAEPVVKEQMPQPKTSVRGAPFNMDNLRRSQSQAKPKEDPRFMLKDLKVRDLPAGKFKASLVHGDPNAKVFAIHESKEEIREYIGYIETSIAEYISKVGPTEYKPIEGEIILAKFEGTYYRGLCNGNDNGKYIIFFREYLTKKNFLTEISIKFSLDFSWLWKHRFRRKGWSHQDWQEADVWTRRMFIKSEYSYLQYHWCPIVFQVHECYFENFPDVATLSDQAAELLSSGEAWVIDAKMNPEHGVYIAKILGL